MNIKTLIGIVHRPWFIEPHAAQHWAELAKAVISSGNMPEGDKRFLYSDSFGVDLGPVFRVNNDGKINASGSIQVFRLNAPIAKYDYCGDPGSQTWVQLLAAANADNTIESIILWIDSPGGQVDGTQSFANAVKESTKPVVAFTDGLMCSAAYWIGSSAKLIITDGANDGWNATIGSIGTMCAWMDYSGQMDKEGVKLVTVFADDSTDKWGDYFAMMKGDFTRMKEELNGINATFLSAVKENRSGKLSLKKENVLTGKTYNANEALENGLVDKIGSFMDAVAAANSLYKKSQTKIKNMSSTTALAFGAVLIAAKATQFSVVEGGFLLTEEHLNNIEAKLDQDNVTAIATTASLKTLQAQSEAFAQAETTAASLLTANAKIATLEADLKTANDSIAAMGKDPGAEMVTTTKKEDKPTDAPETPKAPDSFEKMSAQLLP